MRISRKLVPAIVGLGFIASGGVLAGDEPEMRPPLSPVEVPFCKPTINDIQSRIAAQGMETAYTATIAISVGADGKVVKVEVLEVLPEKNNTAMRWAMQEAKCWKKAVYDPADLEEEDLPYRFTMGLSSTTGVMKYPHR